LGVFVAVGGDFCGFGVLAWEGVHLFVRVVMFFFNFVAQREKNLNF